MDEAARRSQTGKGGPRVLTILPTIDSETGIAAAIVNNCPNCDLPTTVTVWNEDVEEGTVDVLVHGWYTLETDINIFWQQVNPINACTTNPWETGKRLAAGSCIAFFVDQSVIDGIIVIGICPLSDTTSIPQPCGEDLTTSDNTKIGLIRVNRGDTIRLMSDTGDDASAMVPPPSSICNPRPGA